jgi:di/tricarboxylate transporter
MYIKKIFLYFQTGPSGAHFGILACIYIDILYNIFHNWQNDKSYKNEGLKVNLMIYSLVLVLLFSLGLLPWLDNWAHIFGFISGVLLSGVLIKELQFEEKGLNKFRVIVGSFLSFVFMFVVLVIVFYVTPPTEGSWVQYINCAPLDETFCQNMDVSITRGSSYTSFL